MQIHNLYEGVYDPNIFKAVFMAGAPGSGKSTVARQLFAGTGLKTLNVDNFWTLYNKMGREGDYERYWQLFKAQEKNILAGRLGVLIDGTARNPDKMRGVKIELEKLGYETAMVFVNTSLQVSMSRVLSRAEQTGRHVPEDYVRSTYEQTRKGLGRLQSMFDGAFYIVDNSRDPDISYVEKSMRRWLEAAPTKPAAKKWIEIQLDAKRQSDASQRNS